MRDHVILGLHGFSSHSEREMHDAGICIVRNGEVVAAVDEERLSRRKRDGSFPLKALATGLAIAGLRLSDITDVAFVDKRTPWQTMHVWKYAASAFFRTGANPCRYLAFWTRRMLDYRRLPPAGALPCRVRFYEHHLCHAASAYYPGPWPEATIVSLDGMGDFSVGGMVARGDGGNVRILRRCNGYFSPGHFYMILTQYLGFTPGHHEGKVTGLAAHGNSAKAYRVMRRVIQYRKGKQDFSAPLVAEEFFNVIRGGQAEQHPQQNADLRKFRELWSSFSPEDIAAAGQARFEDVICDYVRDAVALAGHPNLVVAGGCFANVRLNQKIMELPEVNGVYVHPNMGDGGLSAGAALLHHHKNTARRGYAQKPWRDVYLGPAYSMAEIESALRAGGVNFEKVGGADIADIAAKNLAAGKVVAWFQGRMEYGPRALGNRSILAAADNPDMPGRLNGLLGRTDFMPFAPVILDAHASDWLDGWKRDHVASRFMTVTYNINRRKRALVPAVVHVDGTARPQVLTKQCNLLLHQVITRYHQLTGIPLLINTSFNMHEEPIVCSPADAVESFKQGAADMLFIGQFAVVS